MQTASWKHYFRDDKPVLCNIHPTLPWLVVVMKHRYTTVVFDYRDGVEVFRFNADILLHRKREEAELLRAAYVGHVESTGTSVSKLGEVRSVLFYDNDVIHWHMLSHTPRDQQQTNSTTLPSSNIIGRWLVLVCELKITVFNLDCMSQSQELSVMGIEGKTITCAVPLFCKPLIAIGGPDGNIRFWNYELHTLLPNKINCGGKPINTLTSLFGPTTTDTTVQLIVGTDNGTVTAVTLSNFSPVTFQHSIAWSQSKALDSSVVDVEFDSETASFAVLSSSGTIALIHKSGQIMRKVKLTKKGQVPRQLIMTRPRSFKCASLSPCFLVLTRFNNVYQISRALDEKTLEDIMVIEHERKKVQVKLYFGTSHPIQKDIFACCTNNGLRVYVLESKWGMSTSAINRRVDENLPLVANDFVSADQYIPSLETTAYYVKGNTLCSRYLECAETGPLQYGEETNTGISVSQSVNGGIGIALSFNGKYLAIVSKESATIQIRNTQTRQVVNSEVIQGVNCVWHSYQDLMATLKYNSSNQPIISIYDVSDGIKVSRIVDEVATIRNPINMFGGRWLGIVYGSEEGEPALQFYNWAGSGTVGGFLPQPKDLLWDDSYELCALVFTDSIAIMKFCTTKNTFSALCDVPLSVGGSYMWWNQTLFVDTLTSIYAIFPAIHKADICLIATSQILGCVTSNIEMLGDDCPSPSIVGTPSVGGQSSKFLEVAKVMGSKGSMMSMTDAKTIQSFNESKTTSKAKTEVNIVPIGHQGITQSNYCTIRPLGPLVLLDIVGTDLVYLDDTSTLKTLPLHDNVSMKWRLVAQSGCVETSMLWSKHPSVNAVEVMHFLVNRGHLQSALNVNNNDGTKLWAAIQHGCYGKAHEILTTMCREEAGTLAESAKHILSYLLVLLHALIPAGSGT